jgi:hypothetical protein
LNILPDKIINIGIECKTINTSDIPLNEFILNELRNI